jgi:hypothetical protein
VQQGPASLIKLPSTLREGEAGGDVLLLVNTVAPPPHVWRGVGYLNPAVELNPQTPQPCHMDLQSARLVLIHLHPHQLHHPYLLQLQLLEPM